MKSCPKCAGAVEVIDYQTPRGIIPVTHCNPCSLWSWREPDGELMGGMGRVVPFAPGEFRPTPAK